jgi:hypothetical protein
LSPPFFENPTARTLNQDFLPPGECARTAAILLAYPQRMHVGIVDSGMLKFMFTIEVAAPLIIGAVLP